MLLRKIRKARWRDSPPAWLPAGSLQADALIDLNTKVNDLSIWQIETDGSNILDVATALICTQDDFSNIDYALIDSAFLPQLDIRIEPGPSPSAYMSACKWHFNLRQLSATKIISLAELIMRQAKIDRIPEKKVRGDFMHRLQQGQIDRDRLNPKLRERLPDA